MSATQLEALVGELEKNKKLLSTSYCLGDGLPEWQKVVELMNKVNSASNKDIQTLLGVIKTKAKIHSSG